MSSEKVARFSKQHFVISLKQTSKALKKDQVTSLIVVKDVEVYLLAQVFGQTNHKGIPITYFESKLALGRTVGTDVNTTIVMLLNES